MRKISREGAKHVLRKVEGGAKDSMSKFEARNPKFETIPNEQ